MFRTQINPEMTAFGLSFGFGLCFGFVFMDLEASGFSFGLPILALEATDFNLPYKL